MATPTIRRRLLVVAVLACTAGAAVALYASSKDWAVHVDPRPAPLTDLRTPRTGGDFVPWVPACALISLAGAGALVATRRLGRRLVGVLLCLTGLAVLAGSVSGLRQAAQGGGATGPGWPVLAAVGGLLIAAVGVLSLATGAGWPTMGSRYERPAARNTVGPHDDPSTVWDAVDRGDDPTRDDPAGPR